MRICGRSGRAAIPLTILLAAACEPAAERMPVQVPDGWFHGNLHTHSLWSGGNEFPEVILDWYRRYGYQFVVLTNHDILGDTETWIPASTIDSNAGRPISGPYLEKFGADGVTREDDGRLVVRLRTTAELGGLFDEPGEFLVVQGEEIMAELSGRPLHIGVANPAEVIAPAGGDSVRAVLANNLQAVQRQAERRSRPILAIVNHPNRDWAITAEDLAATPQARFFEVYNGHPVMHNRGDADHPSTDRMWDIANSLRLSAGAAPLLGVATDDGSNYHGSSGAIPGRGSVFVRAAELSAAALITAMEAGDFYSSTGVVLDDLRWAGGVLSLEITAAGDARFVTRFIGTRRGAAAVGEVLATVSGREPSYRLTGDELYVRAEVTSSELMYAPMPGDQRQMAWTQPVGWR